MAATTLTEPFSPTELVAGIDTHTDTHTLAILTSSGHTLLTQTFCI